MDLTNLKLKVVNAAIAVEVYAVEQHFGLPAWQLDIQNLQELLKFAGVGLTLGSSPFNQRLSKQVSVTRMATSVKQGPA